MHLEPIKEKLKKIGYQYPDEISEALGCPSSFCQFIKVYSGQELFDSFRLYPTPIAYDRVYGREIEALEGMYIFASDQSEYLYAFDSKRGWEVVDIDSDGELFERYGDFESFMHRVLDEKIISLAT